MIKSKHINHINELYDEFRIIRRKIIEAFANAVVVTHSESLGIVDAMVVDNLVIVYCEYGSVPHMMSSCIEASLNLDRDAIIEKLKYPFDVNAILPNRFVCMPIRPMTCNCNDVAKYLHSIKAYVNQTDDIIEYSTRNHHTHCIAMFVVKDDSTEFGEIVQQLKTNLPKGGRIIVIDESRTTIQIVDDSNSLDIPI